MKKRSKLAKSYESVVDLIGNTPLVKLKKITNGTKASIFAKLELMNHGTRSKNKLNYLI